MTGLFADDAVIRRVDSEPLLLVGGGRALLMQLAHPQVAAAVADHSGFRSDPWARLRHTVRAISAIVFGTAAQGEEAAACLRAVHHRVTGPGYRAADPELLLWVHATLVDTALRVHARFLRPLPPDEAARYYSESAVVAELLGVPRDRQPADLAAFRRYVRAMVGTVTVTDTARRLAVDVLRPRFGMAAEPGLLLARQVTAGLLPSRLRRQYGLSWDRPRQAALETAAALSRVVLPRVPRAVRRAPAVLL